MSSKIEDISTIINMGKIEAEDQVCCDLCHMMGGIKLKCERVTILTEEPNCNK